MTDPILTLEPLIDAVRAGVERAGWALSGLQKTTSHQFEGRWEGESTRSAYLFFHRSSGPDWASIDVYLDETGRGLTGNLALVVDLEALGSIDATDVLLDELSAVSRAHLDAKHRRPITVRFRLADAAEPADDAETEVRFKVRIARRTIERGAPETEAFAEAAASAFDGILQAPEVTGRAWTEDD